MPDAEALVGRTQVELYVSLARSACDQGDLDRWHALNRRAVDLLQPDTDPLVASRAHSAFAFSAMGNDLMSGAQDAIRLAVEHAGDAPSEERAYALTAQALLHLEHDRFAAGMDSADQAIHTARAADALDPLLLAMSLKHDALPLMGRLSEACDLAQEAIDVARMAGMVGDALITIGNLANMLILGGKVSEGVTVARAGNQEGLDGRSPRASGPLRWDRW